MSLKSLKVSAQAANEGVWVSMTKYPNSDGTIPSFLLARVSKQNTKYFAGLRELTRDSEMTIEGVSETMADMDDGAIAELFAKTVVLGWKDFQPEDDGFVLEYSVENAKALFLNPDWQDLYDMLSEKARNAATFRAKATEAAAKNS